jgi:3-phosphoshikimate 1-carboxyvinyltransferase
MSKLIAHKSQNLKGQFRLSPSKAHGWRAIFLAGVCDGVSYIKGPKESKDWHKAIYGLERLGAKYEKVDEFTWKVQGFGKQAKVPDDVIDCGNSGPLLRYFPAICAAVLSPQEYAVVTGDESLRHIRLAGPIVKAINQLGGWAITTKNDEHAPVVVRGGLAGGYCEVDGFDSQTVSGLLLGCALSEQDSEIVVHNAGEKGWVALTVDWLKKIGVEVENLGDNWDHFKIKGGQKFQPLKAVIPADWQSAATPILAGVLIPGSEVVINDIDVEDALPDRQVVYALQQMGADIELKENRVIARYSPNLKGITVDPNWYTDQFVPIAIAAAFAEGETVIYNNEIQRHKECNRIEAVADGLRRMGVEVEEKQDGMIIHGQGGKDLKGANLEGYKDHRILMNFVIAGMRADGETTITDAEFLEKSFANFEQQMIGLGAQVKIV